jgi:hypothetical protein
LSVLPLLKNLSIQQKCEIADSCLEPCRKHVIRQTRQVRLYCQSLKKDEAFRELATDVSNNIYVEYGFRYELAQFLKKPENTKKAKKNTLPALSTNRASRQIDQVYSPQVGRVQDGLIPTISDGQADAVPQVTINTDSPERQPSSLTNLSIEEKRAAANWYLRYSRDPGTLPKELVHFYYQSLWQDPIFREFTTDLLSNLDVGDSLRDELIVCVNTGENAKKTEEITSPASLAISEPQRNPRVRFEDMSAALDNDRSIPAIQVAEENISTPHVQSIMALTKLSMVVLQLFSCAVGGGIMLNTLPSPLSMFPLQDFQYGPGVTPFNVNDVKNTESDFQYISLDEFEFGEDEIAYDLDVGIDGGDPKPAIDVLEYQYASYTAYLNFGADNASKLAPYTSFDDYGWSTTVTNAEGYSDMPELVPFDASC